MLFIDTWTKKTYNDKDYWVISIIFQFPLEIHDTKTDIFNIYLSIQNTKDINIEIMFKGIVINLIYSFLFSIVLRDSKISHRN